MKLVLIIEIFLIATNYKQNETKFPYHVGLIIDSTQFCSGVIVSKRYILTAARCLEDSMEADIIMGNPQLLQQQGETVIGWIFLRDPTNQIVLIQLPDELIFNESIDSIDFESIELGDYLEFVVAGWTEIVGGNQQLTTPLSHKIVEINEINNNHNCRFSTTMQDGRNIEDYGSPLITTINRYLIGIVILAEDSEIIYANISCYTDWISEILQY